jgi:hypothetical protein
MGNRQRWNDVFNSFQETHQDTNDFAPALTESERVLCRDLILAAGSEHVVRDAWRDYVHAEPSGTFTTFAETDAAQALVPNPVDPEDPRLCPICHKPGGMGPGGLHLLCEVDRKRKAV